MTQAENREGAFVRLGEIAPQTGQVALVDGALVPLMPFDLPPRLRGQAREDVARRQLRDRLGAAGEALELHPCPVDGDGERWTRALVADAATLADWRSAAGPAPKAVLPDYLALPTAPDLWTVSIEGARARVRLGPKDGFSATPDVARAMLEVALDADTDHPKAVLCTGQAPDIETLLVARNIPVITDPANASALDIAPPQIMGHGEAAIDLRRDPQRTRVQLRRMVLPWRWTCLAALLAVALWSAGVLLEIRQAESRLQQLRAETEALVRSHFVPVGPILDVRVQVTRAVTGPEEADAVTAAPDPLALLRGVAEVVAASDAEAGAVTYDASGGIELTVDVSDFLAVDRLQSALAAAGVEATRQAAHARSSGEGVRAVFAVTDLHTAAKEVSE
ncbi:MAG: hypothetical protein GJ677_02280 [Rhodobacteraceae bacterium]|nr:hypothetical protein [Paracoccaceae bacterium]